jgi:hypothetical protein
MMTSKFTFASLVVVAVLSTPLLAFSEDAAPQLQVRTAEFGLMGGSTFDYRATSPDESYVVVGVAADVLETPVEQPGPAVYLPMTEDDYSKPPFQGITLALRTTPGLDAASIVHARFAAFDANLITFNAETMEDWIVQVMFIV